MRYEKIQGKTRYSIRLARTQAEIREAQRLRWVIFSEEQSVTLNSPEPGFDIDEFDAYCEHLIVIEPQ